MWRITYFARNVVAEVAAIVMRRTGFRFSRSYRHGETRRHRIVYALCNTVRANIRAEGHWFHLA